MKKALIILGMLLVPVVALCQDDDDRQNNVQFGINFSNPQGDPKITIAGSRETLEIDNDNGYYFMYERKFTDKLGLAFGLGVNDYDVDAGSDSPIQGHIGTLKIMPFTSNLLYHPSADSVFDFYIGGGLAYVKYDDIKIRSGFRPLIGDDRVNIDNDTTWNAQLGFNIKFGDSPVGLSVDGKYIPTSADSDAGDLDVDPMTLGAALLVRW